MGDYDIYQSIERIFAEASERVRKEAENVEALAKRLNDQNRKARFVAQCLGVNDETP